MTTMYEAKSGTIADKQKIEININALSVSVYVRQLNFQWMISFQTSEKDWQTN